MDANMDSPRVTVCVPVRNGSRTIRRTLDSILAQAYGIQAATIGETEESIQHGLSKLWADPAALFLLQVEIDPMINAYPKIAFGYPLTQMKLLQNRWIWICKAHKKQCSGESGNSMSKIVIKSENLGKMYHIGRTQERHNTLRDAMMSALGAPLRRLRGSKKAVQTNSFWALKDVSFDVLQGDVLGVIGRNGAGKSTLLKILSRITKPTEGRVQIFGRVASLLEVGTGFHSELSGRDNIYLSGSIMGMKRAEIERKFDEIVDFAEVEKFLDTPVKRYSSGMYVRLAFAVAAHLDPEILLVDEVLSVGDIAFQKKSLGRMQNIAQSGRTVVFVSHAMDTVRKLCNRCILLDGGKIVEAGETAIVVSKYLEGITRKQTRWVRTSQDTEKARDEFAPLELALEYEDGRPISSVVGSSQKIWVRISSEIKDLRPNLVIGFALYNADGTLMFESGHFDVEESKCPELKVGFNTLRAPLPVSLLNAGTYTVEVISALHHMGWIIAHGSGPRVSFDLVLDASESPYTGHQKRGLIVPVLQWERVK